MLVYVQALINIVLCRRGPEDLPDSGFLLVLTVIVYAMLHVPAVFIRDVAMAEVLVQVALSIALAFAFTRILLQLAGFPQRNRQVLTALFGTGALLTALILPLMIWLQSAPQSQSALPLPGLILLIITLWSVVVDAHIIARALSRPFVVGLLLSIVYFLLYQTLRSGLLPPPGVQSMS